MSLRLHHLPWLLLLLNGCASQRAPISATPGPQWSIRLSQEFKTASLVRDEAPATYGFQKAKGKRGSAKESFSEAVELAVSAPAAGIIVPGAVLSIPFMPPLHDGEHPEAYLAVAGAAGAVAVVGASVVAPAVAAKGLIRSWKTVSPQELAECETNLDNALKQAAGQEQFHQFLLAKAAEKSAGRLWAAGPAGTPGPNAGDAVLEARIEELRLERSGSDEGSYFLRIKARARLLREHDGALLYEQPVEYRSGQALFLDWTKYGGVQAVAETGYRALAEYFVNQIF